MDGNCALGGVFLTGLDADLGANPLDAGRLGQSMIGSYSLSRDVLSTFARGAFDGALYDYSNLSSLNQLSTGTTPVLVATDPVGLSLDSRLGLAASTKGVYLSGASGTYLSSPDSVASSITGSIDISIYVYPIKWIPVAAGVFVSKYAFTGSQFSYEFLLDTAGKLVFGRSLTGALAQYIGATSTVATGFTDATSHWVRFSFNVATGDVKFYTSSDGTIWTQLGATVSTAASGIFDGTAPLEIGTENVGTIPFSGKIYSARVYNGIRESGGTLAVNYNGTDYVTGSTLTSSTTGEVWTLNGAAYIAPDGNHALQATAGARPTWQVDAQGFYYLSFPGTPVNLTSATGGGGSAGFFWCGVVQLTGGAGAGRVLFSDAGTNTGYIVRLDLNNKLVFEAGNNTAFTSKASTATVDVGTKYLLTVWDDGTNLNVQINSAAAETVARPVVVAGTAGFTIGKDNGAASRYLIGNLYPPVYFKDTGLTAAQRAAAQVWAKAKGGM